MPVGQHNYTQKYTTKLVIKVYTVKLVIQLNIIVSVVQRNCAQAYIVVAVKQFQAKKREPEGKGKGTSARQDADSEARIQSFTISSFHHVNGSKNQTTWRQQRSSPSRALASCRWSAIALLVGIPALLDALVDLRAGGNLACDELGTLDAELEAMAKVLMRSVVRGESDLIHFPFEATK
ncbi:hypothetical protein GALMADRAFT_278678 [Galerina marginata CBS 339.88]|uniref:Uncharacterized protein n=1 Tax=Galerina marginata (strain CBS 339.88) TaxID=685588 RepID=A0A067TEY1_GALM3|nr:hypothetical protein GALMADRAFT_278678 [Galerina marginata CBS 339.88]